MKKTFIHRRQKIQDGQNYGWLELLSELTIAKRDWFDGGANGNWLGSCAAIGLAVWAGGIGGIDDCNGEVGNGDAAGNDVCDGFVWGGNKFVGGGGIAWALGGCPIGCVGKGTFKGIWPLGI